MAPASPFQIECFPINRIADATVPAWAPHAEIVKARLAKMR
jgi:hypothetical protein